MMSVGRAAGLAKFRAFCNEPHHNLRLKLFSSSLTAAKLGPKTAPLDCSWPERLAASSKRPALEWQAFRNSNAGSFQEAAKRSGQQQSSGAVFEPSLAAVSGVPKVSKFSNFLQLFHKNIIDRPFGCSCCVDACIPAGIPSSGSARSLSE